MRQFVDVGKVLQPEDFIVLVDTREQTPWNLEPLRVLTRGLVTGDYSIAGLTDIVALERKSLPDLVGCVGRERERFERELDRLRAFASRAVVVEASWAQIGAGEWQGQITPRMVLSSIASWTAEGVPFVLAGNREGAADFGRRFLMAVARHAHRRLRAFANTLAEAQLQPTEVA